MNAKWSDLHPSDAGWRVQVDPLPGFEFNCSDGVTRNMRRGLALSPPMPLQEAQMYQELIEAYMNELFQTKRSNT